MEVIYYALLKDIFVFNCRIWEFFDEFNCHQNVNKTRAEITFIKLVNTKLYENNPSLRFGNINNACFTFSIRFAQDSDSATFKSVCAACHAIGGGKLMKSRPC